MPLPPAVTTATFSVVIAPLPAGVAGETAQAVAAITPAGIRPREVGLHSRPIMPLTTPRLILRPWREADRAPLAAITGDARTMRFFAAARSPAQSDAWMDRTQAHIERTATASGPPNFGAPV